MICEKIKFYKTRLHEAGVKVSITLYIKSNMTRNDIYLDGPSRI